jgi:hypothetical protein
MTADLNLLAPIVKTATAAHKLLVILYDDPPKYGDAKASSHRRGTWRSGLCDISNVKASISSSLKGARVLDECVVANDVVSESNDLMAPHT